MVRAVTTLFSIVLVFSASSAFSEVPKTLHYQGCLTDSDGVPIHCPDEADCVLQEGVTLTFRLYESSDAPQSFWNETFYATPVHEGVFNVAIGEKSVLNVAEFASGTVYLGIAINGGDELLPRQKLVSAAYALRSEVAGVAQDADNLEELTLINS